eukprot:1147202-Pelagomonas_calceolata.AAC.2
MRRPIWATAGLLQVEYVMDRACHGQSMSWTEHVMDRACHGQNEWVSAVPLTTTCAASTTAPNLSRSTAKSTTERATSELAQK